MQFETIDDHSAQDGSAGPDAATTPYETERQARAGVYAQRERSNQRGVMGEANLAYLREACDQAGVALGAFDTGSWPGSPDGNQTCAVVAGLVTRAYATRMTAAGSTGLLSEQRGQHQRRPR